MTSELVKFKALSFAAVPHVQDVQHLWNHGYMSKRAAVTAWRRRKLRKSTHHEDSTTPPTHPNRESWVYQGQILGA